MPSLIPPPPPPSLNGNAAIAAVVAVLKTVPAAGPNVYSTIRYARSDDEFNAMALDNTTAGSPIVHTWQVTRESTRGSDIFMQTGKATHAVVAVGYRGFEDTTTEPLWQAELDAIAYALFPYAGRHLQAEGEDVYFDWSGPPQIEGVKLVFYRNALCHTARILMPVEELIP